MRRWAAVLGAVMLVAGCGDDPTSPAEGAPDFELASYDVFGDGYGMPSGPRIGFPAPVLGRLVTEAFAKVRAEQGADAAREIFATLFDLRQEAAAARRAGDRELFHETIVAMHAEAARLVVEILGAPRAQELIDIGTQKLAELDAIIAAKAAEGVDVTRLEHARALAATLLDDAADALADGDVLHALLRAARGAQLATVAVYHATGLRPPRPLRTR